MNDYDILGDFWSSFMTILVVFQNNLCHYNSFRSFFVLVYDTLGDFWSALRKYWWFSKII